MDSGLVQTQGFPVPNRKSRIVDVCLGFHPENGGTASSVEHFRSVFDSEVVNFTATPTGGQRNGVILEVATNSSFLGRQMGWADSRSLTEAQEVLESADLIICHTLFRYHMQWAAGLAYRRSIPYWVVPHGSLDPYVFSYRRFRKELWMRVVGNDVLSRAEAVIFASEEERRKGQLRCASMNAKVIHWPVNLPKLTDRDDAGGAIRADLGISASDRVLLFLGRLHPSKRPLETIQALKLSGAANVHLIIVGMDDLITAESCCRLAADLGLARVHAVGPMFGERKLEYFAAADGFISLSLKDNFSYSVAEALASGTAVILSPGIDLVSELKGTQCGWLLDSFALEAAAAAIREFSRRDTSELQTVGSCGREWARRVLDPGIFDSKLRRLYAQTVAGSHSIRSVDATSPRQNGL